MTSVLPKSLLHIRRLAERELSFTVIPAASYVNDTLNITGIPQNWIIDGNGTVRLKGTGYATAENWVKGMQNAIQEVEASTATTASTAGSL